MALCQSHDLWTGQGLCRPHLLVFVFLLFLLGLKATLYALHIPSFICNAFSSSIRKEKKLFVLLSLVASTQ